MVGSLQVVRIYSFMEEIKVYTLAWYILSFSLLSQKIIIYKRNKTSSQCLHSLVKTSAKFVRILEQVKTLDWVSGFH